MRTHLVCILVVSIGAGLAQARAEDQQPAPAPQPAATASPQEDASNRLICRAMYHNGSIIRTRQCHTQREWDAIRTYNQRQITESQIRGMSSQEH